MFGNEKYNQRKLQSIQQLIRNGNYKKIKTLSLIEYFYVFLIHKFELLQLAIESKNQDIINFFRYNTTCKKGILYELAFNHYTHNSFQKKYTLMKIFLENIQFTQIELDNCHLNNANDDDTNTTTYVYYSGNDLFRQNKPIIKLLCYYGMNSTNRTYKKYLCDDKLFVFLLDYEYQKEKYYLFDINLFKLVFSYIIHKN